MVKTYNPIYRVSEVAEVLRTNRNAVYNLMNSGKLPYLVLNGTDKVTVMVKLFSFKDTPTDAVSVLRASFFAIIPPTILFTIFQKQITDGAATGAVKG